VTTNMRDIEIFEAGRASMRRDIAELARLSGTQTATQIAELMLPDDDPRRARIAKAAHAEMAGNGARKRARKAAAKAAGAGWAPKAPVAAKKVRKDAGPRTKGVKKRLTDLLAGSAALTIAEIIAETGFGENSVRGTLMGLKKAGLAIQDDEKRWLLTAQAASGNSDDAHASANA